ncbi:hypothetical protein BURPSPAST_T0428 [Burkholderia pseudomallei Pasteur 52237]|nr:hypothetical protein BURPSPAST_T0428 [Burkholderia pseudomallei Pasteur 52237]
MKNERRARRARAAVRRAAARGRLDTASMPMITMPEMENHAR